MTDSHSNSFRLKDGIAVFIEGKDVQRIRILNNIVWEKPRAPDLVVASGVKEIYRNSNSDLIANIITNTTITDTTELIKDISFTTDNKRDIEITTVEVSKDGTLDDIMTDIKIIENGEERGIIEYNTNETQGG